MDFRPSRRRFGCASARMPCSAPGSNGVESVALMRSPSGAKASAASIAYEVFEGRARRSSRLTWSEGIFEFSRLLGDRSIGVRLFAPRDGPRGARLWFGDLPPARGPVG